MGCCKTYIVAIERTESTPAVKIMASDVTNNKLNTSKRADTLNAMVLALFLVLNINIYFGHAFESHLLKKTGREY